MDKMLFDDLINALNEAITIRKREIRLSHSFETEQTNVKDVREQDGLSQREFARLIRVSVKTIQNLEHYRRQPSGSAAALLRIFSTLPDTAIKSLRG